ncbi:MAG: endonuclease/exonuclease/phosphatase family protein [Paludibacteraceae bacterium]|nr:endonuclease/exonuclease/phosphatase family protein [Paludibacteraceae bacterium]
MKNLKIYFFIILTCSSILSCTSCKNSEPIDNKYKYAVNIASVENGSVNVLCDGQVVLSGDSLYAGSSITVTAVPNENYELSSMNVSNPFELSKDTTIRVVFAKNSFAFSVAPFEGGTVKVSYRGTEYQPGSIFIKNTYLTVEFVADDDHYFTGSNIANGTGVRDSFKLVSDTIIRPTFETVTVVSPSDYHNVCNYNIRLYTTDDKDTKFWTNRKDKVFEMILNHDMDVCGLEEMTLNQSPDFKSNLVDYEYVGYGRDNGKENSAGGTGEQTGLIYKKTRYVKQDQGRFFLSNTPQRPSKLSGASFNRMVTWVKLKERKSENVFYFFATHFDHPTTQQGIDTRSAEADIALVQVPMIAGNSPLFFVGDFNCEPTEPAYSKLSAQWNDAFIEIGDGAEGGYVCNEQQQANYPEACSEIGNTYTGLYSSSDKEPKRIDYILYTATMIDLFNYIADNDNLGLVTYPSDHLPVITRMEFK